MPRRRALTAVAAVTLSAAPLVPLPAHGAMDGCTRITNATRTQGTVQAVSSTRVLVSGRTEYWEPDLGWTPVTTPYRITVQRQAPSGDWTSFNALAPDATWHITAGPGVYRLAYLRTCDSPFAASSTRAVRVTAPRPKAPRRTVATRPASAYYPNCAAARAAGVAPIARGESGYRAGLDRDGDGIACE